MMASGDWVAELDKKEHKSWVMVGCALNIAKKGITSKIQNKMETWYHTLISSPPLQSLPSCACAPSAPKCATCVTWEKELKRHHTSGRPKICWDNSDRTQWGSPTGAWEIAKVFLPTLGGRKKDAVDAETTDIGGLLNLLEWCPFINPPTSRTVLTSAREECRNRWAHAPKQEIQDADLKTMFGHLNNLLNDAVFSSDKDAQQSSKDLQDLFHKGLVNVRESEIEALHLLRHSLVADLTKCQDDVSDVQSNILKVEAEMKKMVTKNDLGDVKEKADLNGEKISKLAQQLDKLKDVAHNSSDILRAVDDFNRFLSERDDLQDVFEAIQDDLEIFKTILNVTQSKVANIETNLASLQEEVSILQEKVLVLEKGQATQEPNDSDDDVLCTAPSRLPLFTGRKSALDWLEKSFLSERVEANHGTSCCTKTICGLGGCGKTSLAVEFAWSHKNRFPGGLFWINGESDENINKSVAEILSLRNIPSSTNDSIDDTLNKFLTWLSKKDLPWLLVMDNVDELQDPMCPASVKKICKGPWQRTGKSLKNGQILLTTRQNAKDAKAFLRYSTDDFLELSCFSVEDGALFLMKRTGLNGGSLDPGAISLAKELGALPLALEQAAAYITACPISLAFTEYLEKYQTVKVRLLQQQPVTALSMEAQHRLSVNTTWEMNFEYVKQRSPAAATMMQVAAFLESENIPVDVVNPGYPELEQEDLRECARSKFDIAALLKVLSCYSLFSIDHQVKVFGIHKLVQEVVRDRLTTKQRVETLVAATRLLLSALNAKISGTCVEFKYGTLSNLSEIKEEERRLVIALILNVRKLKNHIQEEIDSSHLDEKSTHFLCSEELAELCLIAKLLISNDIFFYNLNNELCDFLLKIKEMQSSHDPVNLLALMVNASIVKRNIMTRETYNDAKRLAQKAVQKLAEFEKSGFVIADDVKYEVLSHMASFYAYEGKWEENYKALLELESFSLSDEKVVGLQFLIGKAEDFMSACNFQCVLERYEKALKLARRVYAPDHYYLLRVLQFITFHLGNHGKLHEARKYAEEMLQIAKKQPPSASYYIRGVTDALVVMRHFDPQSAENTLLRILEERWPVMYKCMQTDPSEAEMDFDQLFVEGSYNHANMVLQGAIECFFVISNSSASQQRRKYTRHTKNLYQNIARCFVALRKKMYGESHPEVKIALSDLAKVYDILGVRDGASKLGEQLRRFNESPVSSQSVATPQIDLTVITARRIKDVANDFFKAQNYSRALEIYHDAIKNCPNDAKLLTNRAITYVKLSEQKGKQCLARKSLIQNALRDTDKAVKSDPSWVKGYYWRAVCLAKLGQRGPSLAAAVVAAHLFPSQCAVISEVVKRFGSYSVKLISTIDDLSQAVERRPDSKNIVILLKEGRYELPKPLKVPANAVMVGMGKVQIICKKSVPLHMDSTAYIENVELSPSIESIKAFKERAKEKLNHDQLDEALSLYSKAIAICPEDAQLLTARASAYLKSAEGKKNVFERESLLELALKDSESAIKADPSWILGYSTKAASLAELERKQEALAAAAVFNHLSSGRDISSVIQRYGALQIHVVNSSDELHNVLQEITEREEVNQIALLKAGNYLLETTAEMKPAIVVVGLGKVTVSCKTGTPFHFRKEHYVENVELHRGGGETLESQTMASSTDDSGQEDVISLPVPSGYDNSSGNSECKVN